MTKTTFLFPEDDEPKDEPDFEKYIPDDKWKAFIIKASEIFEQWSAIKNRLFHRPPREKDEDMLSLPKYIAVVFWLRCKNFFKKSRHCRQGLFKLASEANPEFSMSSMTPSVPKIQYLF